ncbi:MAG TPA: hypothetical protein PK445_03975 [Methanolinea sp.]|nr:hypothetical protein [Methanolinea sp.]HOS81862.1 hypothetical protein [Methanolinea sp.]HPC55928.1 hypothetical protein [Methanolinea sp.]HQE85482.1 hypothetical protein [Methanolinea sp.]HQI14334.1 hypothetical protein [Methanolinea sp.]
MKVRFLPACLFLLALILCSGCSQPHGGSSGSLPGTQTMTAGSTVPPTPVAISIRATPDRYIPLMSSTVGIRLEPEFSPTIPVIYTWTASYGHFVSWNSTDPRVVIHNATVRTVEPSIYWSYPPQDMGREKPPVRVRLVVETERVTHGGRGTVGYSELFIGWEGNDTAVVRA